MDTIKILFLCIHNSARSQMAEAYLKKYGKAQFDSHSAGLEPGKLNPFAVAVMKEDGIDISANAVKDVFEMHRQGKSFDYVVTVCDEGAAARCPVFPGVHKKIRWSFEDPSGFPGSEDEKLASTRIVRDQIKSAVKQLVEEFSVA